MFAYHNAKCVKAKLPSSGASLNSKLKFKMQLILIHVYVSKCKTTGLCKSINSIERLTPPFVCRSQYVMCKIKTYQHP